MGETIKIFTEVEYMRGCIPQRGSFEVAIAEFRAALQKKFPFEVTGAIQYGSTRNGDWGIASDVDYLVVIGRPEAEDVVSKLVAEIWDEHFVTVEPRVVTLEMAYGGMHGIDALFAEDLAHAARGQEPTGTDPLPLLAPHHVEWSDTARLVLDRYFQKLVRDHTQGRPSPETDAREIKRMFEKPYHAMRVVLQHRRGPSNGHPIPRTRAEVIAEYGESPYGDLLELIGPLEPVRQAYLGLLQERLHEPPSIYAYSDILAQMRDCYRSARDFVQANLQRLR